MERSANGTTIVADGAASVVIDPRGWPIVIATWFGEPTELLVDRYFAAHDVILDRARKARERIVLITDAFATERPSAKARKRITDLTAAQPSDVMALTVASYVVIENPMIRGVVTALSWVNPKMAESQNVATITIALERALASLDQAGIPRPKGLTPAGYRRPSRP
jgi:hypothetical protein